MLTLYRWKEAETQLHSLEVSDIGVEELAVLLDQAVSAANVVYTWGHSPPLQPMDVDGYRLLLQSFRERYDPVARERAQHFRPVIGDEEIRGQMLDVISGHLGNSIRDDRLKSALHGTLGGPGEGFTTDDLLGHWLDIAIVRGSHFAARAFLAGVHEPVRYQQMALLRHLRVDREITIAEGVRIVPQAASHTSMPPYLPPRLEPDHLTGWTDLRLADFIHGSILIIDALVSPTFIDPAEKLGVVIPPYDAGVFKYEHVSDESGSFKVEQFCEALSLVIGGGMVIQSPARWSHLDDDHICKVGVPLFGGPAMTSRRKSGSRVFDASEENIRSATNLYRARRDLNRKTAARLNVAIDRWLRSYEDMFLVDRLIDLGIALESLYLDGIRMS